MTIAAVGSFSVIATQAVFTSQATVQNNTFATGVLQVRVNGQPTLAGFTFTNAAPGDCKSGQFGVNNYGQPWFAGPSTLAAKHLTISAVKTGGDQALFDALTVNLEANRGWATRMPVHNGALSAAINKDLLTPRWADLIPGSSEDVYYNVCLPVEAGNSLQGLSTTFNFVIDASNP